MVLASGQNRPERSPAERHQTATGPLGRVIDAGPDRIFRRGPRLDLSGTVLFRQTGGRACLDLRPGPVWPSPATTRKRRRGSTYASGGGRLTGFQRRC